MDKNAFRLTKGSAKNSYDWWWHSFVGRHSETGELKPFFIEYYAINPGLWDGEIVYGQLEENRKKKLKPCYAMIKAGTWGDGKTQLHNFYRISDFHASGKQLDCKIGHNILTEKILSGKVSVTQHESKTYPEWMSDAGSMSWNLSINKKVTFDVGYGSSQLFNMLNAFHMYWHVQGMKCQLTGEVIFNGEKYEVEPNSSFGYQDKNWGRDYTNPWIWLNCNNFHSKLKDKKVDASLDLGGGCPKVFGIALDRRILTAFYYEGLFVEFNFSKFWKMSKQEFNSHEDEKYIYWDVYSENKKYAIDVKFKCKKEKMLHVNYENPKGEKNHNKLWNGGHAEGTLIFYRKEGKEKIVIDELEGSFGGCEYGEY